MSRISLFDAMQGLDPASANRLRLLLERGVKIPPQPRVLDELRRLVGRGESDLRVLAKVINSDPGLAAMLFKVAASPAYRAHGRFDTVDRILHALGIQETVNLLQAIALVCVGDVKKNRQIYEAFWSRSQAIAQFCMLIADERIAVCNIFPDQAYLAGIFHDCGVLLLLERFPAYGSAMRLGRPGWAIDLADEDARFNADHAVVGYLVSRHWQLPEFITDAIRYHHAIQEMGYHDARTMVAILQLAIELHHRYERTENPEWLRIKDDVLPELGLNEDALPEFVDVIIERYHAEV